MSEFNCLQIFHIIHAIRNSCSSPNIEACNPKAVVCIYLYIHTAMNKTILQLVAIYNIKLLFFDVLLTVHLSIFISVFNQLDAQNLFHNMFYFMSLHVSSICAHHQEVKIALHSL